MMVKPRKCNLQEPRNMRLVFLQVSPPRQQKFHNSTRNTFLCFLVCDINFQKSFRMFEMFEYFRSVIPKTLFE